MANQRVNNNIDITNIKKQWFANFTLRQLIFIGIAVSNSISAFYYCGQKCKF